MDENDFVTRQSCQTVERKGRRLLWFGTLCWQNWWTSWINGSLEAKDWVVHEVSWISWIGLYWRRTSRVRVENIPRTHNTAVAQWDPEDDGREQDSTWKFRRSNHLPQQPKSKTLVFRFLQKLEQSPDQELKTSGMKRTYKPNGLWNNSAEMMMLHLRESGHPILRVTSALARGSLKIIGGGKLSILYDGDSETAELLFRIIISVNQLSVYGAVSAWCEEFAQQISDHFSPCTGKPVAEMNDGSVYRISPNVVLILTNPPSISVPVQGDLWRHHNKGFKKSSRRHSSE